MNLSSTTSRNLRHAVYVCLPCAVVCAGMLIAAMPSRAQSQDVAEAARQEKARKEQEAKSKPHVYTEEDLKRDRILTPSDRARVEARKKNSPAPAANQPPSVDAEKNSESLGEIARRYRSEKAAREAEEALKKSPASGFPMNLPAESLAAPKPPMFRHEEARPPMFGEHGVHVVPNFLRPSFPEPPAVLPSAPNASSTPAPPKHPAATPKRFSPFEPRPYVAPMAPSRASRMAPAITPAPNVGVIHGKVRGVIVKPGDSWWKLSRKYLGRGSRWQELAALNAGHINPDFMIAGSVVAIPVVSDSTLAGETSTVRVQKGDTLWSIARAHFGTGAAWTCIATANPNVTDVNRITPGQIVQLPVSCRKP